MATAKRKLGRGASVFGSRHRATDASLSACNNSLCSSHGADCERIVTQTEAVHKPVLTLKQVEATTVDIAELTKQVGDAIAGKQHTRVGPTLEIVNIGTGPALQVEWTLKRFSDTGGFIPYVEVGQCVSLHTASKVKMPAMPTSFQVECRYKSISGMNYFSRTSIENNQEISNFEFGLEPL